MTIHRVPAVVRCRLRVPFLVYPHCVTHPFHVPAWRYSAQWSKARAHGTFFFNHENLEYSSPACHCGHFRQPEVSNCLPDDTDRNRLFPFALIISLWMRPQTRKPSRVPAMPLYRLPPERSSRTIGIPCKSLTFCLCSECTGPFGSAKLPRIRILWPLETVIAQNSSTYRLFTSRGLGELQKARGPNCPIVKAFENAGWI